MIPLGPSWGQAAMFETPWTRPPCLSPLVLFHYPKFKVSACDEPSARGGGVAVVRRPLQIPSSSFN